MKFFTGTEPANFFKNFQDKVGLFPASFSLRKWVDKVVLFWGEGVSMLALCLLNLDLNCFAIPTYVCTTYVRLSSNFGLP